MRRLQRIHARIRNIRHDTIHKATTWLAKTKSVIGMEDLNVSGMMKNRHLSKAIADVGMGMFGTQLEYKTRWYGSAVAKADRWFPSTKKCSGCGHVKEHMGLDERVFKCDKCGLTMGRDSNSSQNLKHFAESWKEKENACERRKLWPSYYDRPGNGRGLGGETTFDEAGSERHLEPKDIS